ncbi:MAG: carboxypeptidase regulatory-like domain-containing protein [Vicinamibacterales bacterium]
MRAHPRLAGRTGLTVILALLALAGGSAQPVSGEAAGGTIRGRVELARTTRSERRPTVAHLGAPAPRGRAEPNPAVVYLTTAPRGAFEQIEGGRARMDQRNETFVPHVLAITTGTTVDFPNSDRIFHNVFSLSKPARFDLGRYPVGRSKSVRFDRAGIVRVFCDIHSHMNAFILVFSHPYFATTDADGRYRIEQVPPGTYTLEAWYEGTTTAPKPVTVPAAGSVEVGFSLR